MLHLCQEKVGCPSLILNESEVISSRRHFFHVLSALRESQSVTGAWADLNEGEKGMISGERKRAGKRGGPWRKMYVDISLSV